MEFRWRRVRPVGPLSVESGFDECNGDRGGRRIVIRVVRSDGSIGVRIRYGNFVDRCLPISDNNRKSSLPVSSLQRDNNRKIWVVVVGINNVLARFHIFPLP